MGLVIRTRLIGFLGVALLFIGLPFAMGIWINLTWVSDPHGVVDSARLANSAQSSDMIALPWGGFVANTDLEGAIEVTCRDGTVTTDGYVSRYSGQSYVVTQDCQLEWSG
ncbi:MAG: hypothetical protein QNJ15_02840 [Erythrobacter sp.]|nr:hypothetical protein [Erythrobacter sp.]